MVGARCEAKKTATEAKKEEPEPEKGMERVWNLKWRAAAGGIGLGSRRRELPEGGRGGESGTKSSAVTPFDCAVQSAHLCHSLLIQR
jgi:hypothetical protein